MEQAKFSSRRSVVHSPRGIVSSTQPLANACGIKVLEKGGNAAMAAVAVAAALNLVEPMSTGVGGDAFAIFYEASTKKVHGINGSGKSPAASSLDRVREDVKGPRIPQTSVHAVTVPGAVAAWVDTFNKWGNGKVTLEEALEPVAQMAENGVPISCVSANMWAHLVDKLKEASPNAGELLNEKGEAPKDGEVFVNKPFAEVIRRIGKDGKDGFYKGPTADAIVEVVKQRGGVLTHEDLEKQKTLDVDTVSVDFRGVDLHELPPNGQGLVALQALGIIKQLEKRGVVDLDKLEHNSVPYLHLLVESLKYAFKDAEEYITDIEKLDYDVNNLLKEDYLAERSKLFSTEKANHDFDHGVIDPALKCDTVYLSVTDQWGNACSFINSLFEGFGSAIVPKNTGFSLQNRGCNFNLVAGTRNAYEPSKRPYHTIIPAMITNAEDKSLYACYGVMGGFMQPQGHIQVLLNMVLFGFNPQEALDAPRFCLTPDPDYKDEGLGTDTPICTQNRCIVCVEEGISDEVIKGLEALGHKVKLVTGAKRGLFGRGQVIKQNGKTFSAGSDLRGDGAAVPFY
uniref:ARAD1B10934p n=1 Tax=Blastobotrys adeninivorans TaxID=409370 RepID=A0A060T5W5_BLAAD